MMMKRFHFVTRGASALRRHPRQCILMASAPFAAFIAGMNGNRVTLSTDARPEPGSTVELLHPDAGVLAAHVIDSDETGVTLAFSDADPATRFGMTRLST